MLSPIRLHGPRCVASLYAPRCDAAHDLYSLRRSAELVGRVAEARATISGMLLELSDADLAIAATACRALAYQEGERAKRMENPTTRGPIESTARRYAALAEKLEAVRKLER